MSSATRISRSLRPEAALAAVDVLGKEVAGELHGDGGRARDAAAEHGALGGAEDADPVDAVVLVEALVLGGEEGLDDGGRHLVERHHGAALEAEIGDEPAVGGVHLGGLGGIVLAERVEGGAGVAAADREPGRQHDGDAEGQRHRGFQGRRHG